MLLENVKEYQRTRVMQITHGSIIKLLRAVQRESEYDDIDPFLLQKRKK